MFLFRDRALRAVEGVTVQSLAGVGGGVPDLLIGAGGRSFLAEVEPVHPLQGRELDNPREYAKGRDV